MEYAKIADADENEWANVAANAMSEGLFDDEYFIANGNTPALLGTDAVYSHFATEVKAMSGLTADEIAKAFEMKVLVNTAHPGKYAGEDIEFVDIDTLLNNSDFVTIHCPLTPETTKMVNADFISKMKDGAFLVNTSRGGELDEEAVKAALDSGKLSGAGVDVLSVEPPVPENPLFHTKNIYITPHIAWASYDTRVRLMQILEENVKCFCNGTPVNVVNNPRV